jgi:hypothetical protein
MKLILCCGLTSKLKSNAGNRLAGLGDLDLACIICGCDCCLAYGSMTPAAASPAAKAAEDISFRLSGRPLLPFREDGRLGPDGVLYPTGERERPLREVMMLGDAPRRDGGLRSYAGGMEDVSMVGISSMTKDCFVVSFIDV